MLRGGGQRAAAPRPPADRDRYLRDFKQCLCIEHVLAK